MATSIYSDNETFKIIYMIPSVSIYSLDQIYLYVEAEREYDLLAIAKIGNSAIPIIIELTSGRFEEIDKLVREARVWPYPLIWVLLEEDRQTTRGQQNIRTPSMLSPRVIDEKDLISLIDHEFICYTKKTWDILPHLLGHDRGQTTVGDQEANLKEIAGSLFALRWLLYSIGAEIPVYLYFSYLYLSKAGLYSSGNNTLHDSSSPWKWASLSLKNTFNLIADGSKSSGQNHALNSILEAYGNIFESELELLEFTIDRQTDAKLTICKIMENHMRLLGILYSELKDLTCSPDRQLNIICPDLCEDGAKSSSASKHPPRIYPRELIEVSKEDNLHLLVLPQRPRRRRDIEDIIGRDMEDDGTCDSERVAMHSCTLKYIVGGRLCEFLNLVRDLKRTCDLSNAIKEIRIAAVEWKRDHECREAEEDFRCLISQNVCDVKAICEEDKEKFKKKFPEYLKNILENPNQDHSLVILMIGDYRKEVIEGILSNISDYIKNKSSSETKIWIAISPLAIYARNPESPYSSNGISLRKTLDVCFLKAGRLGCLQVDPLKLYIDKLTT